MQPNITLLRRGLDTAQLDLSIKERTYWEQCSTGQTQYTQYTEQIIADLHATALYFKNAATQLKLVFNSSNYCYLYTNSLRLVKALVAADTTDTLPITVSKVKKCVLTVAPNTIMLNDPKHKFRTYFKEITMRARVAMQLIAWLRQQQLADEIKCSPSVELYMLKYGNYRTRSHWYIDHNSSSLPSMAGMVSPGLVRKTMNLIRR